MVKQVVTCDLDDHVIARP